MNRTLSLLPLPSSSTTFCFPDFILKPRIPAMPEINIFYPICSGFLKNKKVMLKCGIKNNEHQKRDKKTPAALVLIEFLLLKTVSLAIYYFRKKEKK